MWIQEPSVIIRNTTLDPRNDYAHFDSEQLAFVSLC